MHTDSNTETLSQSVEYGEAGIGGVEGGGERSRRRRRKGRRRRARTISS